MQITIRKPKQLIAESAAVPSNFASLMQQLVQLFSQIDDTMERHVAEGTLDEDEVVRFQAAVEPLLNDLHELVEVTNMPSVED